MLRKIILRDPVNSEWLIFESPVYSLVARCTEEVLPALNEAERRVNEEKLYAAGYVAYEAASGIEQCLTTREPGQLPLLCFGLFGEPARVRHLPEPTPSMKDSLTWTMDSNVAKYRQTIAAIKSEIAQGNCYQVNFTLRQHASDLLDPWTYFRHVANEAPYAAYLKFDRFAIVSASPELLFQRVGDELLCRPMKGTAERGLTLAEDLARKDELRRSAKDRAENVMITDMLRNDIGRIALPGTVSVSSLFDIEKYPTVWQMTSSITAKTGASTSEILRALFPCASVTGAPKVASMAKIAQLEDSPREIYSGSIGYWNAAARAQFNVAIRTLWIDTETHRASYGTGGGIVWDSDTDAEFAECLSKTKVLSGHYQDSHFALLETMKWTKADNYFLLDNHLERLRKSAEYFDFALDVDGIVIVLESLKSLMVSSHHRVRLLSERDGRFRISESALALESPESLQRIQLALAPIDASDPFFYHKTTRRHAYEKARAFLSGANDVLLWNQAGYITETTIANIVIHVGGRWVTPPISCGLLAGTYREWLLQQGVLQERAIHRDELNAGSAIALINSVRGWMDAELVQCSG